MPDGCAIAVAATIFASIVIAVLVFLAVKLFSRLDGLDFRVRVLEEAAERFSRKLDSLTADVTSRDEAPVVREAPPAAFASPARTAASVEVGTAVREKTPEPVAPAAAAVAKARSSPPPRPPSPSAPAAAPRSFEIDWEALIGVKIASRIAAIAFVVAAILFLREAVAKGWLGPPIRMTLGLLTGAGLLVLCEMKAARRYPITANALEAAGIAILFATLVAAHEPWRLIGALLAFIAMAVVAVLAVALAIRRDSLFIALLGLVGGFLTPALLAAGEDQPIPRFTYLLLLNAGLAWVAYKKHWPLLTALSLVGTTVYQWMWVLDHMAAAQLPLAIAIFAVFPILAFAASWIGRGGGGATEGKRPVFEWTAMGSALLPVVFVLYLAAVPAYGSRFEILFGFLFLLVLGLGLIGATRGPRGLHVAAALSSVLVFVIWFAASYTSAAWPAILGIVAAFVLFYLLAPFAAERFRRPLGVSGDHAAVAAALLFFAFPVLASVEARAASPGPLFAVLFVLLAAMAVFALLREQAAGYFLAAFFALAAEAVWSSRHLDASRLLAALAIYTVFALFYLGVPLAARRWKKTLRPQGSGAVLLVCSVVLLFFLAIGPLAESAIWGLALLLAIINFGLIFEAAAGRNPYLCLTGIVLSWIVIAVWWGNAPVAALLVPALLLVAGFAVIVMGGSLWAGAAARAEGIASPPAFGVYLGLVGHLFLLFVAARADLAVPPWPLLGVLLVLDLALLVAALYARRGGLQIAALVGSQVVLLVWECTAQAHPWPAVAILAAALVAVTGMAGFALARRKFAAGAPGIVASSAGLAGGPQARLFAAGAAASLFLAQLVAIVARGLPGEPGIAVLLAAHLVFLLALLGLAWTTGWHVLAVLAVVPTAVAAFLWRVGSAPSDVWREELLLAVPLYLAFIFYPLALGQRAARTLEPYLAAVLASLPFFFVARRALEEAGFAHAIGLLPVVQAALLALLLVNLLRLEPAGKRRSGRLALVAGAALAFVTVAIPLQLDKEWITIGWALQAAALAWLYGKIPHKGLLVWTTGLAAVVFVRLALNPAVLEYHARGDFPIWNWYLYAYLVAAAALFVTARFLGRTDDRLLEGTPRISGLLPGAATVLLFLLVNIEIADFYSKGSHLTFNFSASLSQDLTYTLAWALFAIGLLVAGLVAQSRVARIWALALLSVTVFKCFLFDFGRLRGLYRVGSFVGLAVCLAFVAVLLQKFVISKKSEEK